MNRRKFLLSASALAIAAQLPELSSWSELTPSGYWVRYSRRNEDGREVIVAKLEQRGIDYALGFYSDDASKYHRRLDTLRFSINQTIYRQDEKDGLLKYPQPDSVDDIERYKNFLDEHKAYCG